MTLKIYLYYSEFNIERIIKQKNAFFKVKLKADSSMNLRPYQPMTYIHTKIEILLNGMDKI